MKKSPAKTKKTPTRLGSPNPSDQNQSLMKYYTVVRKKAEREKIPGGECYQCEQVCYFWFLFSFSFLQTIFLTFSNFFSFFQSIVL